MKLLSWWRRLLPSGRKQKLLSAPEVEITTTEEAPLAPTGPEFKPYLTIEAASEPVIAPVIEPALETAIEPTIEPPGEQPALEAAPEPAVIEAKAQPEQLTAVAATVPRDLPPPPYPDELMRLRALYFTPATYSPTRSTQRVLAPDLLFRLGVDTRRAIAEAPPEPAPMPVIVVTPPPRTRAPRLMEDFTTSSESEPHSDSSGRVLNVDPLLLAMFLAEREGGPNVPPAATAEYLTEPALLAHAIALRDRIVEHWSAGGPPLTLFQCYHLARQVTPHVGTALLLCHNVAKAFARGGDAIPWLLVNRARGEYTDGKSTHIAAVLHRNGVLKTGPFATSSIFYLLFSAAEFGPADPGDTYRFFASAAVAWYTASRQTRVPILPPSGVAGGMPQSLVDISQQMMDPALELAPAYRGWLWANAANFLEGATYSRNQAAARAVALAGLRGAGFGLREAGEPLNSIWRWHVPLAGAQLDTPFRLASSSAESLAPDAVPITSV
jgi:hypothetical protein